MTTERCNHLVGKKDQQPYASTLLCKHTALLLWYRVALQQRYRYIAPSAREEKNAYLNEVLTTYVVTPCNVTFEQRCIGGPAF